MLCLVKLLLPALIPSWRFFDAIGPSPRVEYAAAEGWREFRPRPVSLSLTKILRRLVWNPERNESLFLTRCAERLLEAPDPLAAREIEARLAADFGATPAWRIVTVTRKGAA